MNLQNQMKQLFGGSCYCYCIAKLFSGSDDIKKLTTYVLSGWVKGYIDDDGFVSKPLEYIKLVGGEAYRDVEKPSIKSLKDLPTNEDYIVEYVYYNSSHFVIANRDGVVFDPAGNSNSVMYGRVVSYRRFV